MNLYRTIGIACSVLLIINYLIIGPWINFNSSSWFFEYLEIHTSVIFPLASLGFYFSLFKIFQPLNARKLSEPLKLITIFITFSFIAGLVRYFGIYIPSYFSSVLNFSVFIAFLFWAIRLIRNKEIVNPEIIKTKKFALATLVGHLILLVFTIVSILLNISTYIPEYQLFQYTNLVLVVYSIGYSFGLIYFIGIQNRSKKLVA